MTRDMTALMDLTHEKGTGPVRTQRPVYVSLLAPSASTSDYMRTGFDDLTIRQRQVMNLVLSGKASKVIAFDLGISRRTVENHRAKIMKKTHSASIPALARSAVVAALVPSLLRG